MFKLPQGITKLATTQLGPSCQCICL